MNIYSVCNLQRRTDGVVDSETVDKMEKWLIDNFNKNPLFFFDEHRHYFLDGNERYKRKLYDTELCKSQVDTIGTLISIHNDQRFIDTNVYRKGWYRNTIECLFANGIQMKCPDRATSILKPLYSERMVFNDLGYIPKTTTVVKAIKENDLIIGEETYLKIEIDLQELIDFYCNFPFVESDSQHSLDAACIIFTSNSKEEVDKYAAQFKRTLINGKHDNQWVMLPDPIIRTKLIPELNVSKKEEHNLGTYLTMLYSGVVHHGKA